MALAGWEGVMYSIQRWGCMCFQNFGWQCVFEIHVSYESVSGKMCTSVCVDRSATRRKDISDSILHVWKQNQSIYAVMVCSHKLSVWKHWDMQPSHVRSKTATDLLCKVTAKHRNTQVFNMHSLCSVMYNLCQHLTSRSTVVLKIQNEVQKVNGILHLEVSPPLPLRLWLHAWGKYENFRTCGACHEDSDNETQINSPSFDLWRA